ncbi:MAG: DUF4215 domain-containing protein [Deltaproteobacteria bacterium]|nr:DUF4215 domain-containing protein [Deltaproteobacteria bacterium]
MQKVKFSDRTVILLLCTFLSLLLFSLTGCETSSTPRGSGTTDTDTNKVIETDSSKLIDTSGEAPPGCGDGKLADDEECDDGNTKSGDGCSANCLFVAEGWSCNPPGYPCHQVAKCGDGNVVFPELCDDGNLDKGDGCSDLCKVEIGYKCDAGQPSLCTETVCGDSKMEGAESCDDGNAIPFDGCSALCQKEPDCSTGACTSGCGDGLVLGEECDDGNNISGDGCSEDCKVESGYECLQEGCADGDACTLNVAVVYRDFTGGYPTTNDFGLPRYPDTSCDAPVGAKGMVSSSLGSNWKPVQASPPANACAKSIADWYDDSKAGNIKVGYIKLYPDGTTGNYVNRYGENGEKWTGVKNPEQPISNDPCTGASLGTTCLPCSTFNPNQSCAIELMDGNPLFFPVDDFGTDLGEAKVPEQYGALGWPWEKDYPPLSATLHSFYFTSEITYWFAYDENNSATLKFTGDDDVWVFVNGQLAVDLGGAHAPLDGAITINKMDNYGMTTGNVYRINIFHAERKMEGSSFKLTLGGFNTARSECRPECGDGIVGLGEECDDGINDGGYGECGAGCKLDQYCGDGFLQKEYEACDDGNTRNGDECPASCRIIGID